ncbi:MAG: hypothetical protein EPO21_07570 [Chloroflexota bacterium]|nr:MAG: hypothetical protein EPO21_07570 [Chloroflexota bacterium]
MASSVVALLGTLRDLHLRLPDYTLSRLEELVAAKSPDLLCVEISRQSWESDDLEQAPIEVRDALARLSRSSDVTLIPIGAGGSSWSDAGIPTPRHGMLASVRRWLSALLDRMTVDLMRLAGGPRAINSPILEHLCGALCGLQTVLADSGGRQAWTSKNQELLDGILWVLQRDPGRRILVTLDCRRKHWLRRRLQRIPDVTLVDFWKF